jgi:hypothetical protein
MEQEVNAESVFKELREIIGNQAQEIAILKAIINTPPNP